MKIDIKEITHETSWNGKIVWICDYRRPDINKKPIRHIQPVAVLVRSNDHLPKNKTVYYSNNHFVKLTSKGEQSSTVYPVFDNTGYRSNTGEPLMVFDNEQECKEAYCCQVDDIIKAFDEKILNVVKLLENEKMNIIENKTKYL